MSIETPEFNLVESPNNDIEFLERGEIESINTLMGHAPIMVVKLKGHGTALFKPADIKYPDPDFKDKEVLRGELEFLAFSMDQILGFNLVPTSVRRRLLDNDGILQRFVPETEAVLAVRLDFWSRCVDELEIKKAAIFDYLTDAKDRSQTNFLVDQQKRKIWLIDHDYYMFIGVNAGTTPISLIVDRSRRLANQDLPEELINAVSVLTGKIEQVGESVEHEQIKLWLSGIKKRAEILIEERKIPIRVAEWLSYDGNKNL